MGQKYAAYDEHGVIFGFYDSIDSPPPVDASILEITDIEWQKCLSESGWTVKQGGLVSPEPLSVAQILAQSKSAKITKLAASCSDAIIGGYASRALGSAHTYPSKTIDQLNMLGSVSASMLPGVAADWSTPFWCADSEGVWAYRAHSASQIQTAGADGKAHVVLCQSVLDRLTSAVMTAAAIDDVNAVKWPQYSEILS